MCEREKSPCPLGAKTLSAGSWAAGLEDGQTHQVRREREAREDRAPDKCKERVKSEVGTQHPYTRAHLVLNEGKTYSTVYISPDLFIK